MATLFLEAAANEGYAAWVVWLITLPWGAGSELLGNHNLVHKPSCTTCIIENKPYSSVQIGALKEYAPQ